MLSDAIQYLLNPVGLAATSVVLITFFYVKRKWTRSIPSANMGLFGLSNLTEYSKDPSVFLQRCMGKYGCVFKVNMLFTTTYWLLDKRLNKEYLDMKESIWSFSDGMVSWSNVPKLKNRLTANIQGPVLEQNSHSRLFLASTDVC